MCIRKWKFKESEIKQTLRIALFIIVYRPARVERNSNASNVLITATIFGKQNVNINKNNLILLGLRSCISKMKKYQGDVDFNIQCPRVKKMNWHGNTIEMCLSSRTYTCVRVCVCKTNHKSLFISLCDACFVWIALCNSWKTLKWLVVRLYCSFFSAFSFSVRTSKPKWTASIGRERDTEFSHWNRSKRFYHHGEQNKNNTCPIFMRVDFHLLLCCGHKMKVASL